MWPSPARRPSLNDVIATSEGSHLIAYAFESKELTFQLYHPTNGVIQFHIPTDTVHGRTVPSDPKRSRCRLDLVDLGKALAIVEGRYAPPTDIKRFLKHARDRTTIAYGRRASEYGYLLLLKGQYPLLACLVADPAKIEWTTE